MTGNRDRFGELIEDDDVQLSDDITQLARGRLHQVTSSSSCQEELDDVVSMRPRLDKTLSHGRTSTRDEIHHDRCAQLRAILAAARARREAKP